MFQWLNQLDGHVSMHYGAHGVSPSWKILHQPSCRDRIQRSARFEPKYIDPKAPVITSSAFSRSIPLVLSVCCRFSRASEGCAVPLTYRIGHVNALECGAPQTTTSLPSHP